MDEHTSKKLYREFKIWRLLQAQMEQEKQKEAEWDKLAANLARVIELKDKEIKQQKL